MSMNRNQFVCEVLRFVGTYIFAVHFQESILDIWQVNHKSPSGLHILVKIFRALTDDILTNI